MMPGMEVFMRILATTFVLFVLILPAGASAQTVPPRVGRPVELSGPRFGMTVLSDGVRHKLADDANLHVRPVITQFGWQFEKRFSGGDSGLTAVTEGVLLLGGLEQGVALPSASWVVGLRTRNGSEFGVGPNVTAAGVALALAGGVTLRTGTLNIPMNVAVVPSKAGIRVSFLTGFNMRRR